MAGFKSKIFHTVVGLSSELNADTLVYFCYEGDKPSGALLKALDSDTDGAVSSVYESGEFSGESNTSALFRAPAGWGVRNVLLAGVGKRAGNKPDDFRQAAGTISRHVALRKASEILFDCQSALDATRAQALVEGYRLGRWKMTDYKSDPEAKEEIRQTINIVCANRTAEKKILKGVERGAIIAAAVSQCRRLSFHPSNFLTPAKLAEKAKELGRRDGFSVKVLTVEQIKKERMGALLGVNQGSADNQARFIIMQYDGGRAGQAPVVLVGKGVTFDTGGISLKPGMNMHEMKGDMTGSAVVISTISALARLGVKLNVVGLVPTTENMPSGTALKPGDIVTARNGKTIEIINTDAEGRLILADALDYANKFNPQAVIDIATLTGATLYSLGYAGAPIFGTSKPIMDRLRVGSKATAEKVWEMPLWPEYTKQMKSAIADLVNSGGRPAGTATAAAFLKEFIGDYPWGHIDIAYVDLEPSGQPYTPKGPSGFGVRLLIETLSNWKKM